MEVLGFNFLTAKSPLILDYFEPMSNVNAFQEYDTLIHSFIHSKSV